MLRCESESAGRQTVGKTLTQGGDTMPYNMLDTVRAHYTPGNVVYSSYWRSYDLVLDFTMINDWQWKTTVQDCDSRGNATRGQHVRMHSTPPSKGDKVVCNVLHYSPCVTFGKVAYSV